LGRVTQRTVALGNGYLPGAARQRIVAPALAGASGIVGALALAVRAAS